MVQIGRGPINPPRCGATLHRLPVQKKGTRDFTVKRIFSGRSMLMCIWYSERMFNGIQQSSGAKSYETPPALNTAPADHCVLPLTTHLLRSPISALAIHLFSLMSCWQVFVQTKMLLKRQKTIFTQGLLLVRTGGCNMLTICGDVDKLTEPHK